MTIFKDSDYLEIRERLESTNVFSILGLENIGRQIFSIDYWQINLLKNEPSTDLRLLNLNFINNETFFNFSCYESGQ